MATIRKLYRIKPNGSIHESVELEIENYRYMSEFGVEDGKITQDEADKLFEQIDVIYSILQKALYHGVTGKEIGILKEISAGRAMRQDMQLVE
ncbi:MAG: hypothetical protein FWC47_07005 [Oscillospiraceae bacterium]|nr:hypothetical protein [Oscillospiraceae bacterium]